MYLSVAARTTLVGDFLAAQIAGGQAVTEGTRWYLEHLEHLHTIELDHDIFLEDLGEWSCALVLGS